MKIKIVKKATNVKPSGMLLRAFVDEPPMNKK